MNVKHLLFALLPGLFLTLSGAENMILNPDLDLDPRTGLPISWFLSKDAVGEAADLPDGKKGLRLTGSEKNKMCRWMQFLRIEIGKTYQLKGRFKADEGTLVHVYAECNGPWKTFGTGWRKGTGKWETFVIRNIRFEKKDEKRSIYLICGLKNVGTAEFADLELTETDLSAVNYVRNDDFSETDGKGFPKFWRLSKGAEGDVATEPEGKCLRLKALPDNKPSHSIQGGLDLRADVDYQLTVQVKGTQETEFRAYVEVSSPTFQTKSTGWRKCTGGWETVTLRFKYSKFSGKPYLVLNVKGKGEVLICQPRIMETPGTLKNGDFSAGAAHWQVVDGKVAAGGAAGTMTMELNSRDKASSARQSGIEVRKDRFYELRYSVRGGSDKTHRDSQNAVWFRAVPVMNGKILGSAAFLDSFDSWQRKSLAFQAPADGVVDIVLEAKAPYCVDFANIELAEVKNPIPPLVLLPDAPFTFRSGVYSANRDVKKAKITIVNNTVPDAAAYQIRFNDRTFDVKSGDVFFFELDLPSEPGLYPLEVTAADQNGAELAKASLPIRVNPPSEREITFRKDQVMLIDGKPFFPLGTWSVHGKQSNSEKAKIIAECGFNTALADVNNLDDYAENGLMALPRMMETLPKFQDPAHFARWDAKFRKTMLRYQKHPSVIGYFISDEPAWRGVSCDKMVESYNYMRELDPYRPIMLNEAPRGAVSEIRPYTQACDIYGVDIYPVPEPNAHSGLEDRNMTCVGKYADRCREVVYGRKPVWMTLQGWAWGDATKRPVVLPTLHQSRFMAYNAVAHGATGLFWFGLRCWDDRRDFFRDLGTLIRELRAMSPVFIGETIASDDFQCEAPEIRVLRKKAGENIWYIVLNESSHDVKARFRNAGNKALRVFFEDRTVTPENGMFEEPFKAYDVHIYSSAEKLPPPLEIPATRRMTPKVNVPDDYRNANWIWYPGKSSIKDHRAYFKREFTLDEVPEEALVFCTADDWYRLYVNGELFMESYRYGGWNHISFRDAAKLLKPGKNTILIKALDGGGAPCGLLYSITLKYRNGKVMKLCSDKETLTSEDNENWVNADIVTTFGGAPWGSMGTPEPADTDMLDAYGFPF